MNELIGIVTPDNTYNLSGQVSGGSTLSGVVTGGAQYEAYSGSYSVTPSGSVQTLETDGKLMTDDVTVGAIPSDYIGSDIPRRSSISVSQDNNTIHVEDGYYEDDIDTFMGACTVTGASVLIDSQGDATGSIIVGRGGYINSGSHAFYVDDVVTPRSSSDLTASGATVSVPYGYYSADASKTVASGSAGTPTATKGSVSNHTVNVTPSVTNTTGYIEGGTKTGTAVSVSASELVSGNKAITENGTGIDVANYSTVSVDVQGGSPAISVVDTTDAGGGTVRTITALDISDTTATAADVASGKYFYTAAGTKMQGTASGGTLTKLVDYVTVIPTTNATSANKLYVNLTPLSSGVNYVLIMTIASMPEPDAELYKALSEVRANVNGPSSEGAILRPNGTRGTDKNQVLYTSTTGVVSLGGDWGTFMAGETYYIYLFEVI